MLGAVYHCDLPNLSGGRPVTTIQIISEASRAEYVAQCVKQGMQPMSRLHPRHRYYYALVVLE